jgi:triosephosphate isomerase
MKNTFIIGNWKSHKTKKEATEWLEKLAALFKEEAVSYEDKTIILCPPFHLIPLVSSLIHQYQLPLKLGAQDVSPFAQGAYTGEIAASQLKEYVEYVIIGHSERRKYFGESDEIIAQKTKQVQEAGITPLVCVQSSDTPVPEGVTMLAYEPIFAIGTGNADTPEDAEKVLLTFKNKGIQTTIYGGSVNPENVMSFTNQASIDGVLPGTDSLDPDLFFHIIQNS